ncbi:hypothetical protein BIFANG_02729 [Bifidobacterium angulatum DSM 20098 = JCM 7096]|uniref:Uncharacterized protein n=1 Tax=Bifidobacterium angulatum DSM 20098 = JCM 7096 TaxID=518635 RepID=C4FEI9_9BIFI|nr:hypothetical protein BIFANG_02729 [Bifidobacterium angulatum DSM 20098 = JCM 7096]
MRTPLSAKTYALLLSMPHVSNFTSISFRVSSTGVDPTLSVCRLDRRKEM